jgi:hypothetical protein
MIMMKITKHGIVEENSKSLRTDIIIVLTGY